MLLLACGAACSLVVSLDDLGGDAAATDASCSRATLGDGDIDGWLLGGNAQLADGYVALNTCWKSSSGGVVWGSPLVVEPLTVDFDFDMSNNATDSNGYGLGVFVIDSPAPLATCNSGDQLCLVGGNGWAMVVYVGGTNDARSANGMYVGVVNAHTQVISPPPGSVPAGLVTPVSDCTEGGPPNTWHHLHLTSSSGAISATIDQTSVLIDVPRPVVMDAGYVGIGGASGGGFFVRNDIRNVVVQGLCH